VPPANADLFPLRPAGRAGTPKDPEPLHGLGWRSGGADGLRWAPTAGLPGPTAGAADTDAWTAHPWLSGRWAADQPSTKSWSQRGWGPADLAARSWAARSWAELAWEARSWAARSWASRRWTAAAWAASSWPEIG
jgi:hypothetical protein